MNKSIMIGKDVDAKKGFSSARRNDKSIQLVRDESERQLDSLGGVIGNIRRDGAKPSAESIATELGSRSAAERASALLALQQTHGNRYVQRVVSGIQAKLVVGQPGDVYEQEADRVADAVMRMPEPRVQRQPEMEEEEEEVLQTKPVAGQTASLAQRQIEPEEEEEEEVLQTKPLSSQTTSLIQRQIEPEEEEELVQTRPFSEEITPLVQRQVEEEDEGKKKGEEILQTKGAPCQAPEVTADIEARIHSLEGGGWPLSESERTFFEARFGHDFSRVRIHTDARAAEVARAVNAGAFTVGRNIVLGSGQYAPGTVAGRQLLAHELTHVMQQSTGQAHVVQCQRRRTKRRKSKKVTVTTKDIFDEIKKRNPDLAELITPNSLRGGKPPILKGGPVKGGDEHRWIFPIKQVFVGSSSIGTEKVTEKKTGQITIFTHEIKIDWVRTLWLDPEIEKQAPTRKKAQTLAYALPLLHELMHARIMMEKSPHWTQQRTAIFTGYENIVRVANSPFVAPEKKAVRSRLRAVVSLITPPPSKAQMQSKVGHLYEMLVHEMYVAHTLFSAVGKKVNNADIANEYSKLVVETIKKASNISLSDATWTRNYVSPLEREVVKLYNAIDGVWVRPQPEIIPDPSYGGLPGPELVPLVTHLE